MYCTFLAELESVNFIPLLLQQGPRQPLVFGTKMKKWIDHRDPYKALSQ